MRSAVIQRQRIQSIRVTVGGLTVTNMIYSPLVIVEADEQPQNALADSVEPAEDGLSLTVHLKKRCEMVRWRSLYRRGCCFYL